jgi:hypothetical protein
VGSPSFWILLLGEARKSISPVARKRLVSNCTIAPLPSPLPRAGEGTKSSLIPSRNNAEKINMLCNPHGYWLAEHRNKMMHKRIDFYANIVVEHTSVFAQKAISQKICLFTQKKPK